MSGEPKIGNIISAEQIMALESEMPECARELLNYTLHMCAHGMTVNSLLLEKDGALGATQFTQIAADKTGAQFTLWRLALTDIGITSAAAAMEMGQPSRVDISPAGVSDTSRADRRLDIKDGIAVMWWSQGECKSWLFGVDSMGPEPRKLLYLGRPYKTQTWLAPLLEPLRLIDIPEEIVPRSARTRVRREVERLSIQLRPLVANPRDPKHRQKRPHPTPQ